MGGLEIVWNWRIQFDKLGGHLVVRWTQFKLEYCWGINDKTTPGHCELYCLRCPPLLGSPR